MLAPHYSRGSVGEYVARLVARGRRHGVPATVVESWHDLPEYVDFLAAAVGEGLADAAGADRRCCSPPTRCPSGCSVGDPYPDAAARRRPPRSPTPPASTGGRAGRWRGSRPAGRADPWRGPDILEVLDDLAGTGRADGVLVCPQGFVADHLEVLYDLDGVAAARAGELGLAFARTRSLNDDPTVLAALAERVRAVAGAA